EHCRGHGERRLRQHRDLLSAPVSFVATPEGRLGATSTTAAAGIAETTFSANAVGRYTLTATGQTGATGSAQISVGEELDGLSLKVGCGCGAGEVGIALPFAALMLAYTRLRRRLVRSLKNTGALPFVSASSSEADPIAWTG
ncbi:MAG: MYXO-CTERM sorting domain-containing protein, partial [Myxococcaceae bacterium]